MDGLEQPTRFKAVLALSAAGALATLDPAVINTALPSIARNLAVGGGAAIWVINAYQLAVIAALLPLAALGEVIGPRRICLAGLALFTLASGACSLAPSLPLLVAARTVQGLGAAAIISVNTALVRLVYPSSMLGRGLSLNALVVALAFTLGPSLASLILSIGNWRWLFTANICFGAVAAAVSLAWLPPSTHPTTRFDGVSAILAALAFALSFFSFTGTAHGGDRWIAAASMALALGFGAVLMVRQAQHPAPVLALDLLRRPAFALSAATSVCAFAAHGIAFVSLPFLFQRGIGRDAVETGFLMTPWPVAVAGMALIAGRLADRIPAGLLGGGGLAALSIGLAGLADLSAHAGTPLIVAWMVLCGVGFGLFQSPNLKAMMTSAPPHRCGGASGMAALARLLGQGIGASLAAMCLDRLPSRGPDLGLCLGAGLALLGGGCSLLRLRARAGHGFPPAGAAAHPMQDRPLTR